jgi:hypothetical protein
VAVKAFRWPAVKYKLSFGILSKGAILKCNEKKMLTWPRRSSASTQPADHISIDVVYSVAPNISSGAR